MIKVVIDSNIYISGILFSGNPRIILDLAIKGKIQVYISPDILTELKDVLSKKKFNFSPNIIQSIISEIESITTLIVPLKKYNIVTRDIGDNIIIDCAIESKAAYIITGDNDLLTLKEFKNIRIIKPVDFLELYEHLRLAGGQLSIPASSLRPSGFATFYLRCATAKRRLRRGRYMKLSPPPFFY